MHMFPSTRPCLATQLYSHQFLALPPFLPHPQIHFMLWLTLLVGHLYLTLALSRLFCGVHVIAVALIQLAALTTPYAAHEQSGKYAADNGSTHH